MPRPNLDRIRYTFWITRGGLRSVQLLAENREECPSETMRTLLRYAMQHMPPDWRRDLRGKE